MKSNPLTSAPDVSSGRAARIEAGDASLLSPGGLLAFSVLPPAAKSGHCTPMISERIETIPACPACKGSGCKVCEGTGLTEQDCSFAGLAQKRSRIGDQIEDEQACREAIIALRMALSDSLAEMKALHPKPEK